MVNNNALGMFLNRDKGYHLEFALGQGVKSLARFVPGYTPIHPEVLPYWRVYTEDVFDTYPQFHLNTKRLEGNTVLKMAQMVKQSKRYWRTFRSSESLSKRSKREFFPYLFDKYSIKHFIVGGISLPLDSNQFIDYHGSTYHSSEFLDPRDFFLAYFTLLKELESYAKSGGT